MTHPEHSDKSYWERVKDKAAELGTDGCSFATGAFRDCCLEHDCHYRTGETIFGEPITKAEADRRFRSCMQSRSVFGFFSPIAWMRYLMVKKFGRPSAKTQNGVAS
jgi:hypothetical protein